MGATATTHEKGGVIAPVFFVPLVLNVCGGTGATCRQGVKTTRSQACGLDTRHIAAYDSIAKRFWTHRMKGYPSFASGCFGRAKANSSYQTESSRRFHSTVKRSSPCSM